MKNNSYLSFLATPGPFFKPVCRSGRGDLGGYLNKPEIIKVGHEILFQNVNFICSSANAKMEKSNFQFHNSDLRQDI